MSTTGLQPNRAALSLVAFPFEISGLWGARLALIPHCIAQLEDRPHDLSTGEI